MAETKKEVETVSKKEYDSLASEYSRLAKAYNVLLTQVANEYASKLSTQIFAQVDSIEK